MRTTRKTRAFRPLMTEEMEDRRVPSTVPSLAPHVFPTFQIQRPNLNLSFASSNAFLTVPRTILPARGEAGTFLTVTAPAPAAGFGAFNTRFVAPATTAGLNTNVFATSTNPFLVNSNSSSTALGGFVPSVPFGTTSATTPLTATNALTVSPFLTGTIPTLTNFSGNSISTTGNVFGTSLGGLNGFGFGAGTSGLTTLSSLGTSGLGSSSGSTVLTGGLLNTGLTSLAPLFTSSGLTTMSPFSTSSGFGTSGLGFTNGLGMVSSPSLVNSSLATASGLSGAGNSLFLNSASVLNGANTILSGVSTTNQLGANSLFNSGLTMPFLTTGLNTSGLTTSGLTGMTGGMFGSGAANINTGGGVV